MATFFFLSIFMCVCISLMFFFFTVLPFFFLLLNIFYNALNALVQLQRLKRAYWVQTKIGAPIETKRMSPNGLNGSLGVKGHIWAQNGSPEINR